jgi:hypothetical protein
MDSFYTPAALTDDLHVWTVFETYSSGNAIKQSAICYDFSLKSYAITTNALTSAPAPSTIGTGDTGVKYTF